MTDQIRELASDLRAMANDLYCASGVRPTKAYINNATAQSFGLSSGDIIVGLTVVVMNLPTPDDGVIYITHEEWAHDQLSAC